MHWRRWAIRTCATTRKESLTGSAQAYQHKLSIIINAEEVRTFRSAFQYTYGLPTLIVSDGMKLAIVGTAIGVAAAIVLTRLISAVWCCANGCVDVCNCFFWRTRSSVTRLLHSCATCDEGGSAGCASRRVTSQYYKRGISYWTHHCVTIGIKDRPSLNFNETQIAAEFLPRAGKWGYSCAKDEFHHSRPSTAQMK